MFLTINESQFKLCDILYDNKVCLQAKSSMDSNIIRKGSPYRLTAILRITIIEHKVIPFDTIKARLYVWTNENTYMLIFNVYMLCDETYCLKYQYGVFY